LSRAPSHSALEETEPRILADSSAEIVADIRRADFLRLAPFVFPRSRGRRRERRPGNARREGKHQGKGEREREEQGKKATFAFVRVFAKIVVYVVRFPTDPSRDSLTVSK